MIGDRHLPPCRLDLAGLVDATPDLVGAITLDRCAVFMNRGGRQMLGVDEDESLAGLDVLQFYPLEEARRIAEVAFPTALASGSWSGESVLLSRSGRRIDVHQVILAQKSESGEPLLATFARDIGVVRAREEVLRESEERFRGIFEQASVGLAQLDTDGLLLWVNDKLCETLGRPRDELVGRTCADLLEAGDAVNQDEVARVLSGQIPSFECEARFRRREGPAGWGELSLSLVRDQQGRALYGVLFLSDISDRRRARELERRLASVLDATPDFVGTMTADRAPLYLNPAGRRMLGIAQDDDELPAEVLACHPAWARRLISEEAIPEALAGRTWSGETAILRRSGEEVPVLQLVFAHRGVEDELLLTTIARDISELKRHQSAIEESQAQAERASRAKSQILATMSHELRTPLTSVIGFAEMLLDGFYGETNEKQRECLGHIVASGQHLVALINDVLDLAKVEAGRLNLDVVDLDAGALVADLVESYREVANRKRLALTVEAAEGLPSIGADARRLRQIVLNLLSNAVKFTPEGGRIAVSIRRAADRALPNGIWIAVADTGIGIRPEDQARLFEPFEQLDASYSRSQQGTGLGLALTRKLAELHGGRVFLESAGKGQGATFHVVLPQGGLPPSPPSPVASPPSHDEIKDPGER